MAIKLVEPYHITQTRRDVRDALQMTGEMCILIQLYHPSNDPDAPRCQVCYDALYKQSGDPNCTHCWGTTFETGVKAINRVWAVFTGDDNDEPLTKHGVWDSDQRTAQMEAFPILTQRDYVVRVARWSRDLRPLEIAGIWQVGPVKVTGMRTGGRYSEQPFDAVGQVAQLSKMPSNSAIYKYELIGKSFAENSTAVIGDLPPVTQPDTKVVYFPVSAPSAPNPTTPIFDADGFTYVQATASDVWTFNNPMGRYPASLTVYIDGQSVEADEEYPDEHTIVLRFGEPVAGRVVVV